LDVNGDGVIDADEIARAPESLKKLGKNRDGRITMEEAMSPRAGGMRGPGAQGFEAGGRQGQRLDGGRGDEQSARTTRADGALDLAVIWSRGRAEGKGPVRLSHLPLREEDIGSISPLGMMIHAHVTPSNHLSIQPKDRNAAKAHYPIVAPADGFVVDLHRPPLGNPDPGIRAYSGDYRIVIEHSATCYSWFGLVDELDRTVLDAIGGGPRAGQPVGVRVPVKAGQTIAWSGGSHGVDYTLLDTEKTLKGFVDLTQFRQRDPWKPHVVDPFDYMDEPLRSRLLKLNPRTSEPRGGKIDYDIDGRLVGNWYERGTGGYAGKDRRLDYWLGHLAFAYHHIDPTKIVVSLGSFDGRPRQFWVKGNSPDPAKIGVRDGAVKYELVYAAIDNAGQPYEGIDTNRVQGVVLAQVLPGRQIKVETFPGRTARDVRDFSDAPKVYER
jgi:hypothetical protein